MESNNEATFMEKRGVVSVGVTPSVHSGMPSDMLKQGEAICRDETSLKVKTSKSCNCKCDGSCKTNKNHE